MLWKRAKVCRVEYNEGTFFLLRFSCSTSLPVAQPFLSPTALAVHLYMHSVHHSSGYHFADSLGILPYLQEQHPDLTIANVNGSALQRNKAERRRLQRIRSSLLATPSVEPKTLLDVFNIWLINEGGRQLFFGVWASVEE